MIDWTKERAKKNYCGWCDGTPTGHSCDGGCFTRTDFSEEQKRENKVDHILETLKEIPEEIKRLEQREIDLKNELKV